MWQASCFSQVDGFNWEAKFQTMGDYITWEKARPADDIIAAFDREREKADELRRQHTERVRNARANDRQVWSDREPRHE
jgi:hypothetical protein